MFKCDGSFEYGAAHLTLSLYRLNISQWIQIEYQGNR